MKRANLQIASLVLLITQFSLINTEGQAALVRTLNREFDQLNYGGKTDNDVPGPPISASITPEESTNSSPVTMSPKPTALTSRDPRKLGLVDRAYLDAFTILNNDNQCSRLFGGPLATVALTELVLQLKPRYLNRNIAIRMSGPITTVQSHQTGFSFRLFEKVEINLDGSFFRGQSTTERRGSVSPSYLPNTRETRVVVLLHELGHLVKTPDRRWVLADDGDDPVLSLQNTEQIISVCRPQIDSLARLTTQQELEMTLAP